ncbi:helix-turn-helix transcriptional regulator [Streptomyces sp. NPDC048251]|uniref:helix-turn-helix domain-containing protein n=1 Tax=Streptomyces sp. NPDC048251 TaxID=3154501 RepID=UPI0034175409
MRGGRHRRRAHGPRADPRTHRRRHPATGPRSTDQERRHASLTDRERELSQPSTCGWSNVEIAERLQVAETIVKFHISRIRAWTGARDRVQYMGLG